MASWETDISTNFNAKSPTFSPQFQAQFDEYHHHMPIPNMREKFITRQNLENNFLEKNRDAEDWQNMSWETFIRQLQEH